MWGMSEKASWRKEPGAVSREEGVGLARVREAGEGLW